MSLITFCDSCRQAIVNNDDHQVDLRLDGINSDMRNFDLCTRCFNEFKFQIDKLLKILNIKNV